MILAGDIGGTKTLLALYEPDGTPRASVKIREFPSRDFTGLEAVIENFLGAQKNKVTHACFGIPGPITPGRIELPNLPWALDAGEIHSVLDGRILLLNDLEATGYGISALHPEELTPLAEGQPNPEGNAALIAPGTGLGECILFWDGERHKPSASEGGHCDFAPRTPEQIELLRWAWEAKRPRISFDRIASGSGLPLVYEFFKETRSLEESTEISQAVSEAEDPAAEISTMALEKRSALCEKALDTWVAVLGAEAGNLALKALATAGVYLGGGIPPKILPKLKDGTFLAAFRDKGRLSDLVNKISVKVILNDDTALYGTAQYAIESARREQD